MSGLASAVFSIPKRLQDLPPGAFLTVDKLSTGGSLQARRLSSGDVQFYWRYSHDARTYREPIGVYDPVSPPKKLEPTSRGFSVAAARERCRSLARQHKDLRSEGGLPKAKAIEQKRFEAKQQAATDRAFHSLSRLLDDYVNHQTNLGRVSAREAKTLFDRNVTEAWPALAAMPANELTQDHVIDMLRRLTELGRGRTSNKLRTYLRAAYQCAIDVRVSASIPLAFKAYDVHANPVANTRRDARFDCADKRPLSKDELRTYWTLIKDVPGLRGQCLRLHLLTGGQRIEQLVRLRWADVCGDWFTIFDAKGRPGRGPRPHTVPLIKAALRELQAIERVGEHVFSTTEGVKPIFGTTLSGWAVKTVGEAIVDFQLKRVRSGVETLLAANRISREIRGHVQSHGLTGVQARHYDGHDYMQEKREALELLAREVTGEVAKPKAAEMQRDRYAVFTRRTRGWPARQDAHRR